MSEIYEIAASTMRQDMGRIERVGMNMANLFTPGYKREVVLGAPLNAGRVGLVSADTAGAGEAGGALGAAATGDFAALIDGARAPGQAQQRTVTDVRPGTLRITGQPLDLALAGPGYFEVATDAGPAYTRAGNFRLDGGGRIVTAAGLPLQGQAGEIRLAGLDLRSVRIDAAGRVFEGERMVDQLKVLRFDRPALLQRLGNTLLGAADAAGMPRPVADADVQLRQGMLENANVDNAQEMIELTRATRHFESLQRGLQIYDELLGTALRRIAE